MQERQLLLQHAVLRCATLSRWEPPCRQRPEKCGAKKASLRFCVRAQRSGLTCSSVSIVRDSASAVLVSRTFTCDIHRMGFNLLHMAPKAPILQRQTQDEIVRACARARVCVYERVCVRACVRGCVCVRARVCAHESVSVHKRVWP